MTFGEQRRTALELFASPLSRRHECLRDIEYALDWVSGPARNRFPKIWLKGGQGLPTYAAVVAASASHVGGGFVNPPDPASMQRLRASLSEDT